jgi:hypothetical protein
MPPHLSIGPSVRCSNFNRFPHRNQATALALRQTRQQSLEIVMLRGGLLWLIGIPLPVILVLWLLGYLH